MEKILKILKILKEFAGDFWSLWLSLKGLSMRKKIILFVLFSLVLGGVSFFFGGCTNPGSLYIQANLQSALVMLPDLKTYINSDSSLSQEDKEIRIKAVDTWLELNKAKAKELNLLEEKK